MARLLVLMVLFVSSARAEDLGAETCDSTKSSTNVFPTNANAVIGGLFGMRQPGTDGYACGLPKINTMQMYEAARWAISNINNGQRRLPSITLGMKAYDTCFAMTRGVTDFYPRSVSPEGFCSPVSPQQITLGFLGPVSSWTSKTVGTVIKSFAASAVSPRAASTELSNKAMYPTFLRTSPHTALFARVVVEILKKLQWQRIVLVYVDNEYGRAFFDDLAQLAFDDKKCVVRALAVKNGESVDYYKEKFSTLAKSDVKGGIIWGVSFTLDAVLRALDSVIDTKPTVGEIQWIFSDLSLQETYDQRKVTKGALLVRPATTLISEFRDYFVNMEHNVAAQASENPWYREWYMLANKCKLSGVTSKPYTDFLNNCNFIPKGDLTKFVQSPYVDTTIKAVYVFAEALRKASEFKCAGQASFCANLRNMDPLEFHNSYLKQVRYTFQASDGIASLVGQTVQFDGNGDPPESKLTVWQYKNNRMQQVGQFENSVLNMNTTDLQFYNSRRDSPLSQVPTSLCIDNTCIDCIVPNNPAKIVQIPGDILLGSLTHLREEGHEPFTCGKADTVSLQNLVAIKYALSRYSDVLPANTLKNIKLGGLFIGVCSSTDFASSFLINLLSGDRLYQDSLNRYVDPHKIKMFVGASFSRMVKQTDMITSSFRIPELDSSATSVALANRKLYPYFSRAVPSDNVQVAAIMSFMKKMGWKYIQLVVRDDIYGEQATHDMQEHAKQAHICIASVLKFGMTGEQLVTKLYNNWKAKIIVVFGYNSDIRVLLKGLRDMAAKNDFFLIGADPWGTQQTVIQGYENEAAGNVIFTLESPQNQGFRKYLDETFNSLENIQKDPIFSDWYEAEFQCYMNAGTKKNYQKPCDPPGLSVSSKMWISQYTPALISSVYTSAYALHQTLVDVCGSGYTSLCNKARVSPEFSEKLLNYIRNIKLNYVEEGSPYSFEIKDGEGTQNFNIYKIENGQYSKVGTYNTKTMFISSDLNSNSVQKSSYLANSTCTGMCYHCYMYQTQPRMFIPGDFIIGALFGISTPGGVGPFECGSDTTTNGFQYSAAMQYALSTVNSGKAPVKLNGLSIGGFIEDHCSNPRRTYSLLNAFYSGLVKKTMMMQGVDTNKLVPRNVAAWLTDMTNSSAEASSFLQQFNIPVVSPSATSRSLKTNPTFYRAIQGEDTIAMGIVKLAKALNFPYIHSVYGQDYESGVKYLEAAAQQEGICVIQTHVISEKYNISEIVKAINTSTSHVTVLYLSQQDMDTFIEAKRTAKADKLVLISPNPFASVMAGAGNAGKNMLAMKLRAPPTAMSGYLAYINNMKPADNKYFAKYYMKIFKCNLPGHYNYRLACGTNLQDFSADQVSNFALPTINAVYAVVDALDKTLRQFCGDSYDGLCTDFQNANDVETVLLQNMNRVSFVDLASNTFQFRDREGNADYDIIRYTGSQYQTVGSYAGATIQIINENIGDHYRVVQSSCSGGCLQCIQQGLNFTYIPGDILIGGLFDVHQKSFNPFTCGNIKTLHGFQLLEAFNYALDQVNNKEGMFKNILKGIRLGGVGLDTCESAIRTGYLVSNVHNKLTTLVRSGDTIDPDDIDVYIGSYSSDQSIYLARILKDLEIPQISYASTSTQLKDQFRYPYFFRTVPADDHQARAMVNFLDKFNLRYVQVVYTLTNYGEFAAKAFKRLAPEYRICVAQMVLFPDNGTVSKESSNDVITGLMQKPLANTIVVFAGTNYINAFLKAVERNENAKGKFRFLGSETWANNEDAFTGVEKTALGSVTLNIQTKNINDFDLYLESKSPANAQDNPWFNEYYEAIHNCYLTKSDGRYTKQCQTEPEKLSTSIHYKQDSGILHVINSVYSAAFAVDKAVKEVCGENYVTICETYKKKSDRRSLVLQQLQNVSFVDPTHEQFSFSNLMDPVEDKFQYSREGSKGYQFYSIVVRPIKNKEGYDYKEIGTYSSSGKLEISEYLPNWDSSCNRDDSCTECPQIRNSRAARYSILNPTAGSSDKPLTVIGVFDIHKQGMDPYRCGDLEFSDGFQQFLAFWYTFHLPEFRQIRAIAIDTCSNSLRLDQDLWNLMAGRGLCSEIFSKRDQVALSNIGGVIVMNDRNTLAAARVLDPLKVTYISPSARSVLFNNTDAYPYLARTISPRGQLLKVLADIFEKTGWDYVMGIESYWQFEKSGQQEFVTLSTGKSCLRSTYNLPVNPTDQDFTSAVQSLEDQMGSHVVVLFTTKEDTIRIIKAAARRNVLDKFLWVFTDVSAVDVGQWDLPPNVAFKALVLSLRNTEVQYFKEYVAGLDYTPTGNLAGQKIPKEWFDEYYQKLHKCKLMDTNVPLKEFTTICDKNATISASDVLQNPYILPTIAAAYVMGNELNLYKKRECGARSVPDCLSKTEARETILSNVLKTTWPNMKRDIGIERTEDFTFKFNNYRFWDIGYNVQIIDVNPKEGSKVSVVGEWNGDKLTISDEDLLKTFTSTCPENQLCGCTQPESGGQQQQTGPSTTTGPRNFFLYSRNGERMYDWPVWAIAVAVLTSIGIFVTIMILIFLLIFYPIRGGTTVLGFLTILGILGIYGVNFAFFLPASEVICAARRLVMGIVYMIVFACLLVKAVDNWRYSDTEWEGKRYRGITSACALFLCAIGLVCIQAIIPIEWLILVRPTAEKAQGSIHDLWFCHAIDDTYDVGLVQSFIFVMVIVALTAIVAMLSWDSDNNYYESRWILVSCICTAGCFLVWMIVSTNAGYTFRDPTVAIANFVNATLLLLCIPLRKAVLLIVMRNEEKKEKEAEVPYRNGYNDVYTNDAYDPDFIEFQRQDSKQESDAKAISGLAYTGAYTQKTTCLSRRCPKTNIETGTGGDRETRNWCHLAFAGTMDLQLSSIIVVLLITKISGQGTLVRQSCSATQTETEIQADAHAFIGGLVSMHQEGAHGYGCGDIEGDMQSYEAIRWAIELLNKEKIEYNGQFLTDTYVPGIKIGMKVQDYCGRSSTAAYKAESFFPGLSTDSLSCTNSTANLTLGVIGAYNSGASKEVSTFGAKFDIPVISFSATATVLTKSPDFPTFMRTVPPDSNLMKVVVTVLKKIKWTFVVVVYTDNTYGRESLGEIRPLLNSAGICLTTAIQTSSTDVRDETIDPIFLQLSDMVDDKTDDSIMGVLYLGSNAVASALLKRAPHHYSAGSGKIQWVFTDSVSLNANFGSNMYPRGMLVVVPASRFIVEFEDHWVRINETELRAENPWFQQWYEKEYGCSLAGPANKCVLRTEEEKRKSFTQDSFVEPAVHAVYAYARSLRDAQQDKCGAGSSGVCDQLLGMQSDDFLKNYLMKVDFTYSMDERIASMASYEYEPYKAAATLKFDANGDIEDPKFDIWNFNDVPIRGVQGFRFRKVGSYVNNYLDINVNNIRMYQTDRTVAFVNLPASSCPTTGCKPCLGDPVSSKYLFVNGDIIINGIFTLHSKGTSPFSCGSFDMSSRSGAQAMEAFVYAVKNVKTKFGNILNGVELGGLAFDDCYNPSYGPSLISQVQKGSLQVHDLQGNMLKPQSVDAYVASHTSTLTLPVADLMNTLKHPLVAYASGTTVLDDRAKYPYYVRVHEGIALQIPTIIYLLKKYKWYHIQTVVVSGDAYSRNGNDELKRLGAKEGICVVAENELDDDIVSKLRRRSSVMPVVIIALQQHNRRFLERIAADNAGGEFVIIGSATWGDSMKLIDGLESVADGIISLKGRRYFPTSFLTYLTALRVDTNKRNPWFAEWYEAMHDCYIGPDNPKGYANNCSDVSNTPITSGKNFHLDDYTMFIINAVYAVAYGLDKTLVALCGQNYNGVCGNYINAANQASVLMENIRKATFNIDDTSPVEMFKFFGNSGDIPYEIYNFRSNGNKYIKVMEYKVSTKESIDMPGTEMKTYGGASPESIKPTCPGFCPECMYMFHSQKYMYINGDLVIVGIFDVHRQGLNPFGCGSLRDVNGFQYTEAFKFAIDYINSGKFPNLTMIRSGFKLGGLLLDGCTSPERSTTVVSSLLGGLLNLKAPDNEPIRIRKFRGFFTYNSQSTINIAEMLSPVRFPVLSPAATSPVLMDKTRFNTLFRTIPSDKHIAQAMANLAKAMGWSHVMTLNSPDTSSRDTLKEFRKLIEEDNTCILASFEFVTDGSPTLIMQSMAQVKTQVVMVFAEPDMHIGELLEANKALSPGVKFIYVSNRYWDVTEKSPGLKDVISKSIFFQMSNPVITDFINHMTMLNPQTSANPWLAEYYEKIKGCSLDGMTSGLPRCSSPLRLSDRDFKQDIRVLSTINAVFALVKGIDDAMTEACGGGYDTSCNTKFESILSFIDLARFKDLSDQTFEFIEREANRGFIMKQYKMDNGNVSPREIGTYWNGLTITDQQYLKDEFSKLNISGTCGDECREICIPSSTNFKDFSYIYGDIYLVGLFDIHRKGKDSNPYGCSGINNRHGYQLLEAFNFALEFVNDKKGIFKDLLPGVDIGGIGLDVCQNPLRAGNLVANIHSRNIKLQQGTVRPNPDYFDMYIGPFDSESAIRVADVLTPISIPQITYGATSLELQNQYKYRYFLRSVPADDKQARAIISYLKRWDIDNVQIISTFDSVGEKGKEEFIRLAYLNRICVSQNITIGEHGPVTTAEARETLKMVKSKTYAKVVILFVDDPTPILEVVETRKEIYEGYFFIGTDKWGFDNDLLTKIPNLIRNENAMTLDIETADVPEFDAYLENKMPSNYERNGTWFIEAFQEAHRCYLLQTAKSLYPRACSDKSDFGMSRADNYVQDPYVLYVVNAVFSAAIGIHNSLKGLCGNNYYGICSLFLTSGERRERIFHGTQEAKFTDNTKQPFYFTPSGESDRGYHLYKPEMLPMTTDYQYTNIGSYNDTHFLKLWIQYGISEQSVCQVNDEYKCPCVFPEHKPSRYMLVDAPFKQFDLNLVYVGAIHDRDPDNAFQCGPIFSDWHFQQLMAFFYAIELVNKDRNLPGSIKLGGLALDTCNQPMRLGQDMYSLLSGTAMCNSGSVGQVIAPKTIVSVIPFSSHNSILLSGMLSPLKVTMISPAATSVELSNKHFHPYFLRTVPPDNIQAVLMLEVLRSFGWTYATVMYSDSIYGRSAVNALLGSANTQATRSCIANKIELAGDLTLAQAERAVDVVSQQVGANVVILFVEPHQIRLLLQATRNKGLTGRFVWLASDYWGSSHAVTKGLEEEARGAISIQIRSENVGGFIEYMMSLTLKNRRHIPDDWFEEFYQTIHNCRLLNSIVTRHFPKICSGQERITADMVKQDNYILSTIISVFMVAYGLNNIEACRQLPIDVSACLALQQDQRRDMIFNGIKTAQWAVLPEDLKNNSFQFRFTDEGYGDIRYNILNYYRNPEIDQYVYQQIGFYKNGLTLQKGLYKGIGNLDSGVYPTSKCPAGSSCQCLAANGITLIPYISEGSILTSGTKNVIRTDWSYFDVLTGNTVGIPMAKSRFPQIWALVVATLAGIGVFVSVCMFIYLLVVYPVRGGTSILGFILAFGIILLYALVFAFIAHADGQICALRRFCLGIVYAICYSALFVKLVDCWRGRRKDEVKYNKLGRPCGFLMVVLLLIGVQVIIAVEWLILVPPTFDRVLYNGFLWPRCAPIDVYDLGLVLSLIYVMILIVLCVIFGFATFRKSKNHHESRWILGIAVLSIPTWVIWCLVATIGVLKVRDAAVAIGLLINATIMLLCGPLRKLWLLSKYQALIEEEELEYEKEKVGNDYEYASTYGHQYDNAPRLHEGSVRGHFQAHYASSSQPHYMDSSTVSVRNTGTSTFTSRSVSQPQSPTVVVSEGRGFESHHSGGGTVFMNDTFESGHSDGGMVVLSEGRGFESEGRGFESEGRGFESGGGTVVVTETFEPGHPGGVVITSEGQGFESHQSGGGTVVMTETFEPGHPGGVVITSEGPGFESHQSGGGTVIVDEPGYSEGATVFTSGGGFEPQGDEMSTVILPDDSHPYEDPAVFISSSSEPYNGEGATIFVGGGSQSSQGEVVIASSSQPHRVDASAVGGTVQMVEVTPGSGYNPYEDIDMRG
ncbi:uncharacterized protein LOC121368478 [Gigantopelta aegis]|uniref:uncharacterized protein LOC121368478 n=1 Tax=Gigantopelta aegis TaxID=1735272 RepID=UPI001B88D48C|nr:uncharacterized protein LOC121368478 [Gigantopelta aegis]